MPKAEPRLAVITSRLFAENAYVLHLEGSRECVVVDPGLAPEEYLQHLAAENLTPAAILNTHGHADHIAGNAALKERWPECPLVIGAGDADKLGDPAGNLSQMFGLGIVSPPADKFVSEGDRYTAAGFEFEVRETPGHSAGHVVFLWRGGSPWLLLGGDVLFQAGIGRTDFPDGDSEALLHSIREKLFTLPDDTIVLPGHGEQTTIGEEKRHNPFLN